MQFRTHLAERHELLLGEQIAVHDGAVSVHFCQHRTSPDAIVEGDFLQVNESPAPYSCSEPEIPVLPPQVRHVLVVATHILPDALSKQRARVDEVGINEPHQIELWHTPAAGPLAEILCIAVRDANTLVTMEQRRTFSEVRPANPIVGVDRQDELTLRHPYSRVSCGPHSPIWLTHHQVLALLQILQDVQA